jgi:hypothetical protein
MPVGCEERRSPVLIPLAVVLVLSVALQASPSAVIADDATETAESVGAPLGAGAEATGSRGTRSESPYLQVPPEKRNRPPIVPKPGPKGPPVEDPTALEAFDVAARQVQRVPSADASQQARVSGARAVAPFAGLLAGGSSEADEAELYSVRRAGHREHHRRRWPDAGLQHRRLPLAQHSEPRRHLAWWGWRWVFRRDDRHLPRAHRRPLRIRLRRRG